MQGNLTSLAKSTTIPISADFENGFSDDPEMVAKNIVALVNTGVAMTLGNNWPFLVAFQKSIFWVYL